jgi:thiol-disulfide isomerase/thioredoxin
MRKILRLSRFFLLVALLLMGTQVLAQDSTDNSQFVGDPRFPAPDFPTGEDWINVSRPLTMQDLRGKVVILDFWTYGCINCIHMMPIMHQLQAKYGDALAVISVHSAKFANEGQTENIRQIVQRYGLDEPVINDSSFEANSLYANIVYGPGSSLPWPTFVVIDPRGNLFAVQAGEVPFDPFDQVVGGMIAYFDSQNEINRDPLPIQLESDKQPGSALSFPGKVLVDANGGRLFIADSSHNRIVIADLNTDEVLDVIGSGAQGAADGSYGDATFNTPQGMALKGNTLYVADMNNHLIRSVDLTNRMVQTAAGTGKQGYGSEQASLPLQTDLSSPWDLAFDDKNNLYIAMAGDHQIWVMSFNINSVGPLIGDGREGLLDGSFLSAELAQPSGLFFRDGILYFADAESSSIRAADLAAGQVTTLAGPSTNDLFAFGDKDGVFGDSRLQHTLAVTGGDNGLLYVADTYNSKIKQLDPAQKMITTLFGLGGDGGYRDGDASQAQFDEPGGLAYDSGKLYVADTNNDSIRVIDVAAGTVSTITFPNPEALQIADQVTVVGDNSAQGLSIQGDAQTVAAGQGEIVLNITLPDGYKLNDIAPFIADWSSDGSAIQIDAANQEQSIVAPELPVRVPVTLSEGSANLTGDLTIYYCEAVKDSLCFIDRVAVTVPVTVAASESSTEIQVARIITPPAIPTGSGFNG